MLALHLHAEHDEAAAREWWSRALDLPAVGFTRTFVKPRGTGRRKRSHPAGVCRVRVRRSTDAWITVMEWIRELPHLLAVTRC